jgi:chromatin remodeling complex protein RSC6
MAGKNTKTTDIQSNMPTTKKTSKKTKEVKEEAPPKVVEEKKTTKKVVKEEPAPVEQPAAPPAEPVEAPGLELDTEWLNIYQELAQINEQVNELEKRRRLLLKQADKFAKRVVAKAKKSTKRKQTNKSGKAPSGFAKPGPVSAELCQFFGKEEGTHLARTQVTKMLTEYILTNNMQNPECKKEIILDKKLADLLGVPIDTKTTYFTMQQHLASHYKPNTVAAN